MKILRNAKTTVKKFIQYILSIRLGGWCPYCGTIHLFIRKRRQNTAYADDRRNYVTCCAKAFEEIQEYWKERWQDYYSDCM